MYSLLYVNNVNKRLTSIRSPLNKVSSFPFPYCSRDSGSYLLFEGLLVFAIVFTTLLQYSGQLLRPFDHEHAQPYLGAPTTSIFWDPRNHSYRADLKFLSHLNRACQPEHGLSRAPSTNGWVTFSAICHIPPKVTPVVKA